MAFAWLIVFIIALVSTRITNKLKRAKSNQKEGEYVSLDESKTESEEWEQLTEAAAKASSALKGIALASTKAKTPTTAAEKGKAPMQLASVKRKSVARKRGRARGIEIEEPLASEPPPQDFVHISTDRMKAFENRECIGERHVNVAALRDRSAAFGTLFDQAKFSQICHFPETSGYCLHLVRTFYTCAQQLQKNEGGPMKFHTSVRNKKLTITPQLIGEVLGMLSQLVGTHYLKGQISSSIAWRIVVDGICMPDTRSAGNSVLSKELKPEYRFLNFIVCYNIMPNMQTKVLRWDRMLYLYLLGHPSAARGLNMNIPYLIWSRMARYVEHPHPTERLPFPMIIMRILRKFDVDIRSSTYMHSLGTINDSTIVKSLPRQPDETPTPPRSRRPSASTVPPAPAATTATASGLGPFDTSEDEASVTSIYREQQRLSSEQERISIEQGRISSDLARITATQVDLKKKYKSLAKLVKKIFTKFGCSSSDENDSD